MKVRSLYAGAYLELQGHWQASSQIPHPGGKGAIRETALGDFLAQRLPGRYCLGTGTLVSPKGLLSRQCDIVIFDGYRAPLLGPGPAHQLFATNSVFGVIEVKSTLSAEELTGAYQNIMAARTAVGRPFFAGIVAYTAARSLDAVANQLVTLARASHGSRNEVPDLVVVLDQGIVTCDRLGDGRLLRSGNNTLLHFFAQMLRCLDEIESYPVDFDKYLRLPSQVHDLIVEGHDHYIAEASGERFLERLRDDTILRIYQACQSAGRQQIVDEAYLEERKKTSLLAGLVLTRGFVYNPQSKRLILRRDEVREWRDGRAIVPADQLYPQDYIVINGAMYYLDLDSFGPEDFERTPDVLASELYWEQCPRPAGS